MLVADLYPDPAEKNAALNRLGVWFGVGAVLLPFSIGALLDTLGLTQILLIAAALSAIPALLAVALRFPAPKQAGGAPWRDVGRLASNPLVLAFSFLLFVQSGNEFVLSGYMTTFLTRETGASAQTSSYVLALYWVAVMTSRVVLGRSRRAWNGSIVVAVSAAGVALAVVLITLAQSLAMATGAIVLLGLTISPIFTTTLGLAGSRFASHSGSVFGFMIAVALCGGMSQPWVVGHLGEAAGLRTALLVPAGAAVCIGLIALWIGRRMRAPDIS
jgi:fucose permease